LGGPATHRGFSYGRLAPQVADQNGRLIPVGGDGEILLSGEARLELFRLSGHWLGVVAFFDAGDVTVNFDQVNLRNLHYATGADLDYQTAIGIVRMGVGFRLNRLSGVVVPNLAPENPDPGQRWAVHFTFGEAF
jgi:outer membrane protein insertion porin family/translocation and assembly module TamA